MSEMYVCISIIISSSRARELLFAFCCVLRVIMYVVLVSSFFHRGSFYFEGAMDRIYLSKDYTTICMLMGRTLVFACCCVYYVIIIIFFLIILFVILLPIIKIYFIIIYY